MAVRRCPSWWYIALAFVAMGLLGCEKADNGRLEGSGTIEADEVRVSSLVGGIVSEVLVQEGDRVEKGQVLLRFDPMDIELQGRQAKAALRLANGQLALARKGARPEDIASARELVKQAEAGEAAAKADMERAEALAQEGGVTNKQLDDARTRHEVIVSKRRTAQNQLKKALKGARAEELEMAEAQVAQAEALVALADKKLHDCEVTAPMAGIVIHRLMEPGEVGGPGGTLFVLQDLDTVRLTVFVAEPDLGLIRLDDPVKVYIDSHPDKPFAGRVARIRDHAEFTPRNVQTRDERVKLVFGIEIVLDNKDGYLKPGLPADAVFNEGAGGGAKGA